MWLGIKNVIRATHMISLITSSATDPILSSATCRTVNVMDIFNSAPRRRYGDRLYTSPIIHDNFLQTMQKPSGMHHIRTKLFHYLNQNHIPCTTRVWKTTLVRIQNNTNLQQTAWYCRSVFSNLLSFKKNEINKRSFLKLSFANKGLDAINLGNVIHHKSVKYKIPLHFIDQSYASTTPICNKIQEVDAWSQYWRFQV